MAGYWKGIEVSSGSPDNLLEHAIIEYAGSSGWYGGADREAAIHINTEGLLELDAATIRDSAGNGVLNRGMITCSGVIFESIAKDPYVPDNGTGTCG